MDTPVSLHGALQTRGNRLVNQHNEPVVLRGMSLFWSQAGGRFYNRDCLDWLVRDWGCTVLRAAMGVELGGYLTQPEQELQRVLTVVEAAVAAGVYVLVDWHDHRAEAHADEAAAFFDQVSRRFAGVPNLIYELYNEPLGVSWAQTVKPYAERVLRTIRDNGAGNLVVVGTPHWSQDVDAVIPAPLADSNVAYSLHFYAGTHGQAFRDKARLALDHGLPLFVSEYGLSEANGNGPLGLEEARLWYDFMEQHGLSRCAWSVSDKPESSAALYPTAASGGGWSPADLSPNGQALRAELRRWLPAPG